MATTWHNQSLASTLTLIALSGAIYVLIQSIWRLHFSPIARFPGPKLAALTYWYDTYYDIYRGGEYLWQIRRLHEQYGPIIRINPHELHVADPEFFHTLYVGGTNKRDRDPWHTNSLGLEGSMLASPNNDLHRKRRSALAPFFSKESSRKLLPLLQERIDVMIRRLVDLKDSSSAVNLIHVMSAFANDVVMEVCFGTHEHRIEAKNFDPSFQSKVVNSGKAVLLFRHFPIILKTIYSLPTSIATLLPDFADQVKQRQEIGANIEKIRLAGASHKSTSTPTPQRQNIFHHLLNSALPASEKTTDRLTDEGITVVGAGSHTVAWTLSIALYYILASPSILHSLVSEIRSIPPPLPDSDGKDLAKILSQLEKLPYLTAVIKEALRLSYGTSFRLPRISPDVSLRYKHWVIPAGTSVSMTTVLLHQDPATFPEPLAFKPERWVEDTDGKLDRYLTTFSAGSRLCLGINLAWAELYMTLSGLFHAFGGKEGDGKARLELYETDKRDVEIERDFFFPTVREGSKGVRVLVKS